MRKIFFIILICVLFQPVIAFGELNPLLQATSKYDNVEVQVALSVDTLLLANGERIVLIGMEGPRPPRLRQENRDKHGFIIHENDPATPFEVEAWRFVKGLVENKRVRLEFDAERRNEDRLLQAYVFLPDGRMLNEESLRYGYAQLRLRMPNMKYAERFRNAYKEARREMRGMQGNW